VVHSYQLRVKQSKRIKFILQKVNDHGSKGDDLVCCQLEKDFREKRRSLIDPSRSSEQHPQSQESPGGVVAMAFGNRRPRSNLLCFPALISSSVARCRFAPLLVPSKITNTSPTALHTATAIHNHSIGRVPLLREKAAL
jgi:hypothetical protein